MRNDMIYRETQDSTTAYRAPQCKAGPNAQTELRDPLLYSRYNNREAPLHASPSTCSLRQTGASTISPAVRLLGAQDYPFRRKRTVLSPGRVLFAGKNRSFCPPVAKTSDSCPLTRYVVDLFDDFLLIESHFFQTPHFYGLYPAKNRSSCPEAAKMNDSSQLTKENARFGHDRLKWASFALQQSGSHLARIAFNMQLAANRS